MGVFSDIWSWVTSSLDSMKQWVWDQLLAAQAWVVEAINKLTADMRVWRFQFRQKVAEWMENPVIFWLTVYEAVGLMIAIPLLADWMTTTKIYAVILAAKDYIVNVTGDIFIKIGYIQALALHRIGLILLPAYQEFWGKIDVALAGLAEEVNLGVGTINVLMQATRSLYYSTYSMFGYSSDMIETTFYDDTTKWLKTANENITRYVRDPQLVFTDFQNAIVFPALEQQALAGEKTALALVNINNVTQDLIKSSDKIRKDVNTLIEALPDDIEKSVKIHVGEGLEAVNKFYTDELLPLMTKIDNSVNVLEKTIENVRAAMEANSAKQIDFVDMVRLALFSGDLDSSKAKATIKAMLVKILDGDTETLEDQLMLENMSRTIDDSYDDIKYATSAIPLPSSHTPVKLSDIKTVRGGWFVGEY